MSLRFRQTFTLFPGVRLNVGKRGISASFGVPGATVNLRKRGLKATVGLPGYNPLRFLSLVCHLKWL